MSNLNAKIDGNTLTPYIVIHNILTHSQYRNIFKSMLTTLVYYWRIPWRACGC